MSIRLVRKSSETPNIANRDDTCSVRHAYGSDGYIANYGNGMGYAVLSSTSFRIQGGRVNIQGWEIDIDNQIIPINLESFSGTRYDFIYLEINLLLESTELKTVRAVENVFPLSLGDDLTQNPNGIARLPLYMIPVTSQGISTTQLIQIIALPIQRSGPRFESAERRLNNIEYRLEMLGFKKGAVLLDFDGTIDTNFIYRQGNYIIGALECTDISLDLSNIIATGYQPIGKVPENFRPEAEVSMSVAGRWSYLGTTSNAIINIRIDTSGAIKIAYSTTGMQNFILKQLYIYFGYEAEPLDSEGVGL